MKFHKDGTLPERDEIFVFGSNLRGIHGAGAAKVAAEKFGASWGEAKGLVSPFAYAIPTKGMKFEVLPLDQIAAGVAIFCNFAREMGEQHKFEFWVTRVGCGLAGYMDREIAPLFRAYGTPDNCSFAQQWKRYLLTPPVTDVT